MMPHSPLFAGLLETSLRASVVILLLVVCRAGLRRGFGSGVVASLWLVVTMRLLFPFPVELPWNMPSPSTWLPRASLHAGPSNPTIRAFVASAGAGPRSATVFRNPDLHAPFTAWPLVERIFSPRAIWLPLWWLGVAMALANLVRSAWRVRRWRARTLPVPPGATLATVFGSLPSSLRRNVSLRLTDDLAVPTLAGIVRPEIWFPGAWLHRLNAPELRHVLLHELGHAHRRDLLAQWFDSLACCLHWFNPLVWLLAHHARADRELACDAWVLARGGGIHEPAEDPAAYGHTLLKLVGGLRDPVHFRTSPATVAMAVRHTNLGLRVREIGAYRPLPWWRGLFALGVAAVCFVVSTAGSAAAPEAQNPPAALSALSSPEPAPVASPLPVTIATTTPASIRIESKFVEVEASALHAMSKTTDPGCLPAKLLENLEALAALNASYTSGPPTRFLLSQLLTPDETPDFIRVLNQQKGVDLLSAPLVMTSSDQQATIEIIREFIYPIKVRRTVAADGKPLVTPTDFDKKNTGLTLTVTPSVAPGQDLIDLKISWQMVSFEGFATKDGGPARAGASLDEQHPVFSTQIIDTWISFHSGETLLVGNPRYDPEALVVLKGEKRAQSGTPFDPGEHPLESSVLLGLITARLIEPAGVLNPAATGGAGPAVSAPAAPALSSNPAVSGVPGPEALKRRLAAAIPVPGMPGHYQLADGTDAVPYAVPVPGKPGFVISPWAPDAGYVDVRGYQPGDQVPDPYTQKPFRVP